MQAIKEMVSGKELDIQDAPTICSQISFSAVVEDDVKELAEDGVPSELLCADDLVLMSKRIEGISNKFRRLKEAHKRKGLNVNLGKTKLIISGAVQGWLV